MILAWLIFWASVGAIVVGCTLIYLTQQDGWVWLVGTASLVAVVFLIAGLVISLKRHYGRVSCRTFAAQTHRPTRFVVYTSWDAGDCLTRSGNGTWIPTKNLREFGAKP